jgi:hypothetical protein
MKIMTNAKYVAALFRVRGEERREILEFINSVRRSLPKTATKKLNLLRMILVELDPVYGELDEARPRGKKREVKP